MEHLTEEEAIALLRKHATNEEAYAKILAHGRAVAARALEIGHEIAQHHPVDLTLVKSAAILHDIGRFSCHDTAAVRHGVAGAEILRSEGLPQHAAIAETHVGFGITRQDITEQHLDLPLADYVPKTLEQKIICYADKLIAGTRRISLKEVTERFCRELGEQYLKRIAHLHQEIEQLRGS